MDFLGIKLMDLTPVLTLNKLLFEIYADPHIIMGK